MVSSITTKIPSEPFTHGCIANLHSTPPCANSTLGFTATDFESICCDGNIVDSSQDIWNPVAGAENSIWDLANLVCCRTLAPEPGGIQPIIAGNGRTCTGGTSTPLASLAATNTANAQIYPVTFLDASGLPPNLEDFTATKTPQCLWAPTGNGIAMTEVTVPEASITTLPVGWPNSESPLTQSPAITQPAESTTTTSSSQSSGARTTSPGAAFNISLWHLPISMTLPLMVLLAQSQF